MQRRLATGSTLERQMFYGTTTSNKIQWDYIRKTSRKWKNLPTLVSRVSKDGGALDDIKSRINKARHAIQTLKPARQFSVLLPQKRSQNIQHKCKINHSLRIGYVWCTIKTSRNKLQTFVNRCLRNIIIIWPDVTSNEDLWKRANRVQIEIDIKRRK